MSRSSLCFIAWPSLANWQVVYSGSANRDGKALQDATDCVCGLAGRHPGAVPKTSRRADDAVTSRTWLPLPPYPAVNASDSQKRVAAVNVNVFAADVAALARGHAVDLMAKVLGRAHRFVFLLEVREQPCSLGPILALSLVRCKGLEWIFSGHRNTASSCGVCVVLGWLSWRPCAQQTGWSDYV